jgi:hypothetical protein
MFFLSNLTNGNNFSMAGMGDTAGFNWVWVGSQLAVTSVNAIAIKVSTGTITGVCSLYGIVE